MLSFGHQENMLCELFLHFDQQKCFDLSSMHVEDIPRGPFYRLYALSPTLDKNFKMPVDEEDCSGEIYGLYERRNERKVENCDTL